METQNTNKGLGCLRMEDQDVRILVENISFLQLLRKDHLTISALSSKFN